MSAGPYLDLLDWRRRVSSLYAAVRSASEPEAAWRTWRTTRDDLFAAHPQSPIPEASRATFSGPAYFDYDPGARVLGEVHDTSPQHYDIATSGDTTMGFTRVAVISFVLAREPAELEAYWLDGYGGGLFLPFRDATAGTETYGAGRYLLDTVKGADLGSSGGRLVLDFNFSYNPSCSYDPRWVCPLAPPANRIDAAVRAGERHG